MDRYSSNGEWDLFDTSVENSYSVTEGRLVVQFPAVIFTLHLQHKVILMAAAPASVLQSDICRTLRIQVGCTHMHANGKNNGHFCKLWV